MPVLRPPLLAVLLASVLLASVAAGCVADEPSSAPVASDEVWIAEVVAEGLEGPTQLAVAPDGAWLVAQLAGGEGDGTGQVVRVDPVAGAVSGVVLDGLDKPTGVAVFDDAIWVQERRSLSRAELDGSARRVVVDDMASNGRSEGSLTVDAAGGAAGGAAGDRLLFDTSGSLGVRTDEPVDPATSSGVLWAIDTDGAIGAVAHGFKHAYAQTRDGAGVLWTVEIADGVYDGEVALDEIVAVEPGADHGWPRCVDDNRPVAQFDGTVETCGAAPASLVLFDAGATPTSIAVAPWDDGLLVVTLWNAGEVVAVRTDGTGSHVVLDSVERPQQAVVVDGRLLLVDFGGGRILELRPS